MAKKAELSPAGETLQFKSLSDFAFAHAGLTGKVQAMARYAIDNIAGFPAECPDESKAELKAGYQKKWGVDHPPIMFINVGGNYLAETDIDTTKLTGDHERRTISLADVRSGKWNGGNRGNRPSQAAFARPVPCASSFFRSRT